MENRKLSVQEQVDHMKSKGIEFNILDENSSKVFLSDNNYYFKLKAYAKNYEKNSDGKYINLEFAYLKDLSTIDMHLRRFIIRITLDIEHTLKTKLLRDCVNNQREDGYSIVTEFLRTYPELASRIRQKSNKSYTSDLFNKFEKNFAIWNIVELLTFGDFIMLYKYYYKCYPSNHSYSDLLFPIKALRNAAAHSNCVINTLKTPYHVDFNPNYRLNGLIKSVPDILHLKPKTKLKNTVIHDFIATLYLFDIVSFSDKIKQHTYEDLKVLLSGRVIQNKAYYADNAALKDNYEFIVKIVEFISNKPYNDNDEKRG